MDWLKPKTKLKEFALAAVAVGKIGGAARHEYGMDEKKRRKRKKKAQKKKAF